MSTISSVIIVHFICFTVSQNTWVGDGTYWWRSTSDFIPTQRTAFGTLTLRDALYMEFDIVFHGPKPSNWQNVFRIGFPSYAGDCANHNSRYPSLWMLPDENKFHFSVSESANCGKQWGSQPPVTIDFQYHVIIHYNDSHILISLNNVIYIDTARTPTKPELIGRTMYVYIGTDDTGTTIPVANATLTNIAIVSYWYHDGFTMPPTYAPTNHPSLPPSKSPSVTPTQPTFHPSTHPTVTPTHNPSSSPTNVPTSSPSVYPTEHPTLHPSAAPTQNPSITPTHDPSVAPTRYPTTHPSIVPSHHPTRTPIVPPSMSPTHTPSIVPTHTPFTQAPSPEPTDMPTSDPITRPIATWTQTDAPIVTLIKYVDSGQDIDPIIALIVENVIYIAIALVTCFAICCPVLSIWFCCYAKCCPAEKEGDDMMHSEDSDPTLHANGFGAKSEEEFLGQEEAAGHKTESSGSSWTIPIKRSIQQKEFDERMEDAAVVPRPAFDALGLLEGGSGDGGTDEEFSSESAEVQRQRDRAIRAEQRRLHEDRFLGQEMREMYKVDTTSDVEVDENIAIYRNNQAMDEDDEKQPYLGAITAIERNGKEHDHEGDMSTEPEFAGSGGMGVTSMDLEEALDDGLSIVPSTGQYEHSERTRAGSNITTEPLPSSRVSDSTLSNNYKPRKRPHFQAGVQLVSNGSGSSHSTPTTIDEEKEIDERWDTNAERELKVNLNAPPVQHIPRHRYHAQEQVEVRRQQGNSNKKKVNWNGNPFIPKHELETEYIETNEYREPQRVYIARSNGSGSSSSDSTHEYTDEYYEEDSEDELRMVHNLQMQMDLARVPKQDPLQTRERFNDFVD